MPNMYCQSKGLTDPLARAPWNGKSKGKGDGKDDQCQQACKHGSKLYQRNPERGIVGEQAGRVIVQQESKPVLSEEREGKGRRRLMDDEVWFGN